MIKSILRSVLRPVVQSLTALVSRLAYLFNGTNMFALLGYQCRLVNATIKFKISNMSSTGSDQLLIGRPLSLDIGVTSTGFLRLRVGTGLSNFIDQTTTVNVFDGSEYSIEFTRTGSTYRLLVNGVERVNVVDAQLISLYVQRVFAGNSANYGKGKVYDIEVNGVAWPMTNVRQAVQLHNAAGLQVELVATPNIWPLTGWLTNNVSAVQDGTGTKLTHSNGNPGLRMSVSQSISLTPGMAYVAQIDARSLVGTNIVLTGPFGGLGGPYTEADFPLSVVFNAVQTTGTIGIATDVTTPGVSFVLNSVSVKAIGPIGSELVSNGHFSTDTSGWSGSGIATVSRSTGYPGYDATGVLRVGFDSGLGHAFTTVALTAGTYLLSAQIIDWTVTTSRLLQLVDANNTLIAEFDFSNPGFYTGGVVVVPAGTYQIRIKNDNTGNPAFIVVDNVSLRQVTSPALPLTIQNHVKSNWQ